MIANISRELYSDIMDRWQEPDMMQYQVPVYHKDEVRHVNGEEVPIFYWATHVFEGDAGKVIIEKLGEIGVRYDG